MADPYHGFGSPDVFTLNIGPSQNQKQLMVPRDILTRIPYFETALRSGSFTESSEKTFNLTNDDPRAVADVIHFSYTGIVPGLLHDVNEMGSILREHRHRATDYVKAYVVADKFRAESTRNKLGDALLRYMAECSVNAAKINILHDAGLGEGSLCQLLLDDAAYTILVGHRSEQNRERFCTKVRKTQLIDLVMAMGRVKSMTSRPTTTALANPCKLHKHELTKPCAE